MPWEDSDLSRAIRAGNPAAEGELVRRFRDRIRRKVESSLSGWPDCEDLANEILQSTLTSLREGRFRGESQLSTFVYAITRNKIAEYLRRPRPETTQLTEDIPDAALSPEEQVFRQEVARAVERALARLKPKYREVLYLYYYRDLTVAEIGAELGLPPRRVSERKDYALRVMRSLFRPGPEDFR